jgi:hypothetical protein
MPAGRPPQRYTHVEKVDADDDVKRRLHVLLRALNGEIRALDAQEELGLSETRFHALRQLMLQGAADALTPRRGGRPRKVLDPAEEEIARLKRELELAEQALKIARVRAELALVLPDRLGPPEPDSAQKKKRPRPRRRRGRTTS